MGRRQSKSNAYVLFSICSTETYSAHMHKKWTEEIPDTLTARFYKRNESLNASTITLTLFVKDGGVRETYCKPTSVPRNHILNCVIIQAEKRKRQAEAAARARAAAEEAARKLEQIQHQLKADGSGVDPGKRPDVVVNSGASNVEPSQKPLLGDKALLTMDPAVAAAMAIEAAAAQVNICCVV